MEKVHLSDILKDPGILEGGAVHCTRCPATIDMVEDANEVDDELVCNDCFTQATIEAVRGLQANDPEPE